MKILIATGGSGGHIFPALSTAVQLRALGHQVVFTGTPGLATEKISRERFDFISLCAKGISFSSPRRLFSSLGCMIRALFQALRILKSQHPDVVAGFGGYGAFPVVLAAALSRYPTLIHEQNVVPGKANYVLSKIVKKIAVSFSASKKHFNARKTVLTGCPCRAQRKSVNNDELLEKFGLDKGKKTILVLGGSQGSHKINEEFLKAVPLLKKDLEFQVIHLSGKNDYLKLKEAYRGLDVRVCLFDFYDAVEEVYALADLVVSRCGAVTVTEIILFELPCILIPYPFAGGHQRENARVLSEAGAGKIIDEKDITALRLTQEMADILRDKAFKERIPGRINGIIFPDAAVRLANEIISL